MDEPEIAKFSLDLSQLVIKYRYVVFFGFSIIFFASMVLLAFNGGERQSAFTTPLASLLPTKTIPPTGNITVDIAGAVRHPGVYQLVPGSRVKDLVLAAGGFDETSVDGNFVARELNLAAKLNDGQKLYIVHKGENKAAIPPAVLSAVTTTSVSSSNLNLNTATTTDLEALPGIGNVTAQKIISNRPYQSVEDLLSKKVVSKSVYEKIKTSVTAQ